MSETLPAVFSFDYKLRRFGWADVTLVSDSREITFTVSYLSDALGLLAGAVASLCQGAPMAFVTMETEPGEHLITLGRYPSEDGAEMIEVRLLSDKATVVWHSPRRGQAEEWAHHQIPHTLLESGAIQEEIDSDGLRQLERIHLPLLDFVQEMERTLSRVWTEAGGQQGYQALWSGEEQPFPEESHREIQGWLKFQDESVRT